MAKSVSVSDQQIDATVEKFELSVFSTKDFVARFSEDYPQEWSQIAMTYGVGGNGAGRYYTSNAFLAQQLKKKSARGTLKTLHYEPAPKGWGSSIIRYWTANLNYSDRGDFPDEAGNDKFIEGAKRTVVVNRYERDPKARKACVDYYGPACQVCERDFRSMYGNMGEKFIHVHHIKPMSMRQKEYEVDPIEDLVPVCPNCHAMLHRGEVMLSIGQLKRIWRKYNLNG